MENNINPKQRQKLQIVVIIILVLFLLVYVFFLLGKRMNIAIEQNTNQVVFQQPLLKIFDYQETLNAYPDKILMHYPYLLVIKPNEGTTQLYNLQTKKKDKKINEVLLDYFEGITVHNKQGKTYIDNKALPIFCDLAFFKTKQDLLCVTKPEKNKLDTALISINTETLVKNTLYTSQNLLTALYYQKDTIYLGEYNPTTQKAFISINDKQVSAPDVINLIYPMQNNMYAASFKSVRNKNIESYYLLQGKLIKEMEKGQIILF